MAQCPTCEREIPEDEARPVLSGDGAIGRYNPVEIHLAEVDFADCRGCGAKLKRREVNGKPGPWMLRDA
jgi:hypothetical protein